MGTKWKNFNFQKISINDHSRVMEHLRHNFVTDEPINRIFGGFEEERFAYLDLRVRIFLSQNSSLVAIDDDTKQVNKLAYNASILYRQTKY